MRGAAVCGDGGDGEEAKELRHGGVLEVRQPCGEPTEGGVVGCVVGNEVMNVPLRPLSRVVNRGSAPSKRPNQK